MRVQPRSASAAAGSCCGSNQGCPTVLFSNVLLYNIQHQLYHQLKSKYVPAAVSRASSNKHDALRSCTHLDGANTLFGLAVNVRADSYGAEGQPRDWLRSCDCHGRQEVNVTDRGGTLIGKQGKTTERHALVALRKFKIKRKKKDMFMVLFRICVRLA